MPLFRNRRRNSGRCLDPWDNSLQVCVDSSLEIRPNAGNHSERFAEVLTAVIHNRGARERGRFPKRIEGEVIELHIGQALKQRAKRGLAGGYREIQTIRLDSRCELSN